MAFVLGVTRLQCAIALRPCGEGVIEKIAQQMPIYAVFRDASLADDSAAANFEELFKTYSPDTIRRVI